MLPTALNFDSDTDTVLDALGNPVRRQILARLGSGPLSVGELAESFAISRPAISRHLAQLEAVGLVRHESIGNRNLYRLEREGFEQAAQWLTRFWDRAETRLKLVAANLRTGRG
ncbi:MAG TPA: metalloregulator ArsR/SmtB family transcription factor [Devosiaceae bacterium]|jgi:DNA-binding transcriptional ArsR family regulator|nr:metalloregulator ArsR/SmtB family transcription factor [Devosiaceae bacterium]